MAGRAAVPVYLRQLMADGKTRLMELHAAELSHHHLFLAADDLSLLDVGEEVELLIAVPGERLCAGRARVVGSQRVFGKRAGLAAGGLRLTASGYRLAWSAPDGRLRAAIDRCLHGR